MIRIKIDLAPDREALYRGALGRLCGVEEAPADEYDAIITGDLAAASKSPTPCLLDQPELNHLDQPSVNRVMPAHEWRFRPGARSVQASNAGGQLGEPGLLRIHHWLTSEIAPETAALSQVDLSHWLFGGPSVESHFVTRPDYLQVHLGYPEGGMAILDVATNRPGAGSYHSLHLIGSEGAAYADDHHNAHLLFDHRGAHALLPRENQLLALEAMLEEFLAGIREAREWSVNILDTWTAGQTVKEVQLG